MTFLSGRRTDAVERSRAWLVNKFGQVDDADATTLAKLGLIGDWSGWTITAARRDLIVAVDGRFPYSVPKIFIADEAYFLQPHIEKFGRLCLSEDGAGVDPEHPDLIVGLLIDRAIVLLSEIDAGIHADDFARDFPAYWRRTNDLGPRIYTLIEDRRQTRHLLAWRAPSMLLVAENVEQANRWLDHRFGKQEGRDFGSALAVWFPALPTPDVYPTTVNDLRRICATDASAIDEQLASGQENLVVLLQGPSTAETIATGAAFLRPARRHGWSARSARPGFRPGKDPPANVLACTWRLNRSTVSSVVASASRMPPTSNALKSKHVVVIGCGSLGSGVARLLVQSGIERLTLIDPDTLGFENIMRHELGATNVGVEKAEGLARALQSEFPHVANVHAINASWEDVVGKQGEGVFDDAHLILSLTGDWNSEVLLSDFARSRPHFPSLVFSWMERAAAATHVLATSKDGACFRCGFDAVGSLKISATSWRTPLQDDGCAAPISPYGGVELANAQSAVAQAVLDILLDRAVPPFRRVWLASSDSLEASGGAWSNEWIAMFGEPQRSGQHIAAAWPVREDCACQRCDIES